MATQPRAGDGASFGALLRQHRLERGLSQEALADKAGVSLRGVSDLERGARRAPHPATIGRLASALELDAEARSRLVAAGRRGQRPDHSVSVTSAPTWPPLPVALSSFVGRGRELSEIQTLLAETRLLTLAGAGGIGKTRLALEVARRASQSGTESALVELAPLAPVDAAVDQAIAAGLGLADRAGQGPLREHVASAIAAHEVLLVLDNCEHLVEACANAVDYLLRTCSGLRVLATSREPLGVGGEVVWRVPTLPVPDGSSGAGDVASVEAVQLFVERARAALPGFGLHDANASAVVEVVRRLDGIPLALELAAARVRALSVQQIAERLDDRFWLLVGGGRTVLPRQRTLSATLDWSYQLLSAGEKALLGRLSVFAGGCCLEAVEVVGAAEPVASGEVLDLMTSLVDKSLVLADAPDDGGEVRYRLLESIRQFAADRLLEDGETSAARNRHLAWAVRWAEAATPHLVGPDQVRWLRRVALEHENFLAALGWCRTQGDGANELRLAAALGRFWHLHGPSREGRAWLRHALEATTGAPPSVAGAVALNWAGRLATVNGDADDRQLLEASVGSARAVGDTRVLALALRHLSMAAQQHGDDATARSTMESALAAAREAGDRREEAFALISLGAAAEQAGAGAVATSLLADGLVVAREVGDAGPVGWALSVLGAIAVREGQYEQAGELLSEALALSRPMGYWAVTVASLAQLGGLALAQGDFVEAREHARACIAAAHEVGDLGLMAAALTCFADLDLQTGFSSRGIRLLGAESAWRSGLVARRFVSFWSWPAPRIDSARAHLGDGAFERAWHAGQRMSLDAAIQEALDDYDGRLLRRRLPARSPAGATTADQPRRRRS